MNKEYYIIIWKDIFGIHRSIFKYASSKIVAMLHYNDVSVQLPRIKKTVEWEGDLEIISGKYVYDPPSREVLYVFTVKPKYVQY